MYDPTDPTGIDLEALLSGTGVGTGDAVESARSAMAATPESTAALHKARSAFSAMFDYHERRRRARNYLWGDQWSDMIEGDDGTSITEEAYIREQGRVPWRMNHLAPTVRNLKGQYRQNRSERQAFAVDREDEAAAEMMTTALRAVRRINRMATIEAAGFQELLMSGLVAFRVGYQYWPRLMREDVRAERLPMARFFMSSDADDPRLDDLRVIGMVLDLTPEDIIASFGEGDIAREAAIRDMVGASENSAYETFGRGAAGDFEDPTFESPSELGRVRVVELWERVYQRETIAHDEATGEYGPIEGTEAELARAQQQRELLGLPPLRTETRLRPAWRGWYLLPGGEVLWSGMSPYAHKEHPFVVGVADMIDGRVKGIVDDLIEQQRLYNRQIQVLDQVLAHQARGVLMIPEEMIPDGVTPEQFADSYQRANGLIVYRMKDDSGMTLPPGTRPEQIYANSLPAGAFEWLATMRDNLEYTSGVRGAVMGEAPKSGTSGKRYNQEVSQGMLTTVDYFDAFFETVRELDTKLVAMIAEHYDGSRPLRTHDGRVVMFDPETVRDLPFDVTIANVADTASARLAYEEDLTAFLMQRLITFPQFLELSGHPKAQAIQSVLQRTNPAFGGDPQAQEMILQAAMMGDPQAAQLAEQAGLGQPPAMPTSPPPAQA